MYIKFDVEFPEDGVISPESRALLVKVRSQKLRVRLWPSSPPTMIF